MEKFIVLFFVLLLSACDSVNTEKIAESVKKPFAEQSIDAPIVTSKNIYVILDGSGSGISKYAIPKMDLASIETLINNLSQSGGGHLYLNYVDKDANNNHISHCKVPCLPEKPVLRAKFIGEQNYQYQKLQKEYAAALTAYKSKYSQTVSLIEILKATFHAQWEEYLEVGYKDRSPSEDYSDVVGVVNAAFRSLGPAQAGEQNFILAMSDLENDIPKEATPKALNPKPFGIKLIRVNASDSGQKITPTDYETDSFENALDLIFNNK